MPTLAKFTLPETHAAFAEWSRLTGHDWDSPEWGEVMAALDSCNLLRVDRVPQRALFDPPDLPLGDTREVRQLRAVIVGSARLCAAGWEHDLATSATIVAAVLTNSLYSAESDTFDELLLRVEVDVPARLRVLVDSPGDALAELLAMHIKDTPLPDVVGRIMAAARDDDAFAERLFATLGDAPGYRLELLALCDGRWLVYDVS